MKTGLASFIPEMRNENRVNLDDPFLIRRRQPNIIRWVAFSWQGLKQ